MALICSEIVTDFDDNKKIKELTLGYTDKKQFFIDKLAQEAGTIAAAFFPKPVIIRMSDFKSNEYRCLIGGKFFEPEEENPMIGFRGASRYYHPNYQAAFALECAAMKKIRNEMGLTNVKLMLPFVRTIDDAKSAIQEMAKHGLKQGENGLELYMMCEIPSNVLLIDQFSKLFDGFSIGSNDLTQTILAVDRDSELVSNIFDERNDAVKLMLEGAIKGARRNNKKIGICGQAPSDYPEIAEFLIKLKIDSISLNPDAVIKEIILLAK
jgi:pyruvate,water dikinase